MGRGDLYVTVVVRTPSALSAKERELYEELSEIASSQQEGHKKGFFSKMKDSLG